MRWKTLYWNIIFSLKHGSVQTHDNFVNSYPYIITFCLLSHFIYIYIYNEILIKRFSEKNLCLSSYQTILYFYYHRYTLSQYPGGDCSTNWEKCQIFKILWGETQEKISTRETTKPIGRQRSPLGRQRNPLGMKWKPSELNCQIYSADLKIYIPDWAKITEMAE